MMDLSAVYICPRRSLAGFEPPEPDTLARAGRVAAEMGLTRLDLPLPEEPLADSRRRVRYLDGIIAALDAIDNAGLKAGIIPLAGRVMGLTIGRPELYKPGETASMPLVLLAGKLRRLRPLEWWLDPARMKTHVRLVRETAAALSGHPALETWLLMDRLETNLKPPTDSLDWLLRALIEEVRTRDESVGLEIGLDWTGLVHPEPGLSLGGQVERVRLAGMENPPRWADPGRVGGLTREIALAGYLSVMAGWLWQRPVAVEVGWSLARIGAGGSNGGHRDAGRLANALQAAAAAGLATLAWPGLVDPEPSRGQEPPWSLISGSQTMGLLDTGLEPKEWLAALAEFLPATPPEPDPDLSFIDIERNTYWSDASMHLERLWRHWRGGREV